ncbi:GMC family oxidoreductase [Nonomuraea sp. K274]|uniref:GMC family oxidoreductase n=1 Tax=Nonomuraea cypriaca TaxID=1187855 RepID=A0A931A314_9ACTN|nr:GMC family oxidoreductase [Nonomuraea cypriaca]MBF8185281.1 GMC family oxidoreductase [Nonomuraea cypriaca]
MSGTTAFDVIVVGSGAAGGMAAYELSREGLRVLMLEAGRDYDPGTETPMFHTQEIAPLRSVLTPDKPNGFYDATVDGGQVIEGEPYTDAPGTPPDLEFYWWRPRMLGGRTNHWGRVALRFGPYDFKPKTRDGLGFDWPIEYTDLAPWYDKVESFIGVTGLPHGIENVPDSPPGVHLPPPTPRAHEIVLSRAFERLGMKVAAIRAAILTQPLNGRAACLYATPCIRGCSSRSNFQSTTVLIPPARATGNLTVVCDAMVSRIDVDETGRATGVSYNDRVTGAEHSVPGRVVVLAAGTCSSVRILLNSRSDAFPNGLGNGRGLVGKYLMDSVEFNRDSRIPMLENIPPQNDDGIFAPHIYVPWWLLQAAPGELDFPRGYRIEPRGGRRMPTMSVGGYVHAGSATYGDALRAEVRRKFGSFVTLIGEGEMIPNEDSFCELDPTYKDKWGVPVLRFHWKWGESEIRQAKHMQATFDKVFQLLGGAPDPAPFKMPRPGGAVHEVGGARMGTSPENSVLDSYNQCWEARNVFVFDGASFVSSPDKGPTLTIMALAARGSARILDLIKGGAL